MDKQKSIGRPSVTDADRLKIEGWLKNGHSPQVIKAWVPYHLSTIYTVKRLMEAREGAA